MKKAVFSLFLFILLLFPLNSVSAHVGGVPFLKINGQYAPANTAYFSNPELKENIPQDMGAAKYLVNKEIEFEIDRDQIPVQKDLIDQATFRWSFEDGSTDYSFGLKVKHTYTKTGSHLMSLDVKAPEDKTFTPYDVIQIDVVSDLNYQTPTGVVQISTQEMAPGTPLNFTADIRTDPSAKIESFYWFNGSDRLDNQTKLTKTFTGKDFFELVFLSYKDTNGFIGYRGIWLEEDKGKIVLNYPPNSHDEVKVNEGKTTLKGEADKSNANLLIFVIPILALVVGVILVRRKKK